MTEREAGEENERRDRRSVRSSPPATEESLRREREERARMDALARSDANQFLRNGFFQDEAVAREKDDRDDARILVATYGQWSRPLKTHDDVSSVTLYVPPPGPDPPTGKDAELLDFARSSENWDHFRPELLENHELFKTEVRRLVSEGGSLLRSHALRAAVEANRLALVDFILETEPLTANALDEQGVTPLMHAAVRAAWRQNIDGMPETRVIDRLLLAGARRDLTSRSGRTAFGFLVRQMDEMGVKMTAENGWAGAENVFCRSGGQTPGLREVALKLMPPAGPTAADARGKESANEFIDYAEDSGSDQSDY